MSKSASITLQLTNRAALALITESISQPVARRAWLTQWASSITKRSSTPRPNKLFNTDSSFSLALICHSTHQRQQSIPSTTHNNFLQSTTTTNLKSFNNGSCPGKPRLFSPFGFLPVLKQKLCGYCHWFLQARWPSCHQTNSVKSLNWTEPVFTRQKLAKTLPSLACTIILSGMKIDLYGHVWDRAVKLTR